ncbi:MAG: response regulator [Pyrinomonadaceae bacterium]
MENHTSNSSGRRILCVEDNQDTCEVLSFIFRDYEMTFANTVKDALPRIENEEFDLYILDNWLPDGTGIELCRIIRNLRPFSPIVFTSAVGMKDSIDEAVGAGANRYLLKPVEPDILCSVVKELLDPIDPQKLSI